MSPAERSPCCAARTLRLLSIPGLQGSGPGHWQTWLERRDRGSRRVEQADWSHGELDTWAARIDAVLEAEPPGPWLAVAHSYGALALLAHLLRQPAGTDPPVQGVVAALLVAPADPARHAAAARLAARVPLRQITVVASSNDPWLPTGDALPWAQRWGARLVDAGDLGHINPAAGLGPWPLAQQLVAQARQRWHARCRAADEPARAVYRALPARPGNTLPTLAST